MRRTFRAGLVAFAALLPVAALAQDAALGEVVSPILTVDQERVYAESAWGKRAAAEIDAASAALAAENRRIEAELTAEERKLTDERATTPVEAFRAKADAFDRKVVSIRAAQDAKTRDLNRLRDAERQAFLNAALPVLGGVLRDRKALAILDVRAVFISSNAIDVTDDVIAALNARLGAGTAPKLDPEPPGGDN